MTTSELADGFDWWMKNTRPHADSHDKELLQWLYCNHYPLENIENYEEFCEVAKAVAAKGYKTESLIPRSEYDRTVEIGKQEEEKYRPLREKMEATMFSHRPASNKIVQSAATVTLLDAIDGYSRPGGACAVYESDLIDVCDIFTPRP